MHLFRFSAIIIFFIAITSCTSLESPGNHPTLNTETLRVQTYELKPSLVSLSRIEAKTREATIKVLTQRGHGSGTYFTYRNKHIVITASHVTVGGEIFTVLDKDGNKRVGKLIYADPSADFSIILIPAFETISPIELKVPDYNPAEEYDRSVIFSSYPGRQSLRTVRGRIAGTEGRYVILHSTAWPGSSGAGVFDKKGNFVGVLFALSITSFNKLPVLLESMIWIEPYNNISWRLLNKVIDNLN